MLCETKCNIRIITECRRMPAVIIFTETQWMCKIISVGYSGSVGNNSGRNRVASHVRIM